MINLTGAGSTLGVTLLAWGVFTLYMWISTFRLNGALQLVFLTLWITFFLLGLGVLLNAHGLAIAGGWVGLACGLLAVYTSFALVTNTTAGREVLPVWPYKSTASA